MTKHFALPKISQTNQMKKTTKHQGTPDNKQNPIALPKAIHIQSNN